jgi:hypothetical protein
MTLLKEKEMPKVASRAASYTWEIILGFFGLVAALVGAVIYYGDPTDTFSVFGWEWQYGSVAGEWAYGLLVGASVVLSAVFTAAAAKLHRRDSGWSGSASLAAVLAVVAFAGAVTVALIWVI